MYAMSRYCPKPLVFPVLTARRTAVRYTSALIGRMMMASPAQSITTRAFSSAIPLRFSPARPSYYDNPSSPPVRSNPLVGNTVPVEPTPAIRESQPTSPFQTAPTPGPPSSPSTPYSSPEAPMLPPRPPPLLPQSDADADADTDAYTYADGEEAPSPTKVSFAYDAAKNHAPVQLADIIAVKVNKYGIAHGTPNPLNYPRVRTEAVVGRTVFIKDRVAQQSAPSAAVAVRVLDKLCRDQKIKNKYHSQKFHERKGLMKKRLRRERWRARFKEGFKAVVTRVVELKRQGW
ncbi:hypothetical protein E4U42_002906 [Claviceps africana]|uniref:Ribosomal protein S21 n=1 Tax=Claviceps africana TaxID=83212 RepID=A0A8K0NJF5_9HYPO|nr:hypothetical protein E4U42_002906 [Claviceps africana]